MNRATPKSRMAASLVDVVVVGLLQQMLFGYYTRNNTLWTVLALVAAAWIYFATFESSSSQGTVGKVGFRIRVTDLAGEPVGFGRATIRFFLKLVTIIPLGLGFWLAIRDEHGQALYDRLAGTMVIRAPQE